MRRWKYSKLACLALLGALLVPHRAAAAAPGRVLRDYLAARWKGDVAAARELWDSEDLRRTQALGTDYTGLEARFDDNLLWSAEERTAAARTLRPVVRDSVIDGAWAHFAVVLQPQGGGTPDTLQYWVRKTTDDWRVSSPFPRLASRWTLREGRYYRLYASKLRLVNADALRELDEGLARILDRLGTSDLSRVRLERIKLEFYLCDTDSALRALGVHRGQSTYRLAGERVATRTLVDLNAATRALVHLSLKETPPVTTSLLEDGIAAALGGWSTYTGEVALQRGAVLATSRPAELEAALDPRAMQSMEGDVAVPLAALWSETLLEALGPQKFLDLYRSLSATSVDAADATDVRAALEAATRKKGAALADLALATAKGARVPLASGCTTLPVETRAFQPVLRWRDPEESWALDVFETGDEYTCVMGPYQGPVPKWAQQLIDSLAVARGEKPKPAPPARPRPTGDPPKIVILIRARTMLEADAYESPLFAEQFAQRPYSGDLYGLLITPDAARFYDYRRDVLSGVAGADFELPGGPPYYDEKTGRICFRLRRDLLARPMLEYRAMTLVYTGE